MKIVRCVHCNHEWPTNMDRPKRCPNPACRAVQWDVPYRRRRGRRKEYDDRAHEMDLVRVKRYQAKKKSVA